MYLIKLTRLLSELVNLYKKSKMFFKFRLIILKIPNALMFFFNVLWIQILHFHSLKALG